MLVENAPSATCSISLRLKSNVCKFMSPSSVLLPILTNALLFNDSISNRRWAEKVLFSISRKCPLDKSTIRKDEEEFFPPISIIFFESDVTSWPDKFKCCRDVKFANDLSSIIRILLSLKSKDVTRFRSLNIVWLTYLISMPLKDKISTVLGKSGTKSNWFSDRNISFKFCWQNNIRLFICVIWAWCKSNSWTWVRKSISMAMLTQNVGLHGPWYKALWPLVLTKWRI